MTDDRITVTGELKLPEGADVEAFAQAYVEAAKRGAFTFEPDGYYDTDGKPVITGLSLVRRKS